MRFEKSVSRAFSAAANVVAVYLCAASLFLWTAPAQNISAQNTSPPANQDAAGTSPAAARTPIPVSEVIAQAENASSTLKEIAAAASADPATEAVERKLPALTEEINARLEETAQTVEGFTSLDNLRTFETDWRALTRSLPEWENDLTNRARKLENDLQRLDDLTETWQKTREELKNREAPPEVISRIEEILRIAAQTRRQLTAQQARVVTLQNRIAEQQNRVAGALKTIAARREALVGQLLVQDSPPIWRGEIFTRGADGIRQSVSQSLAAQTEALGAFAVRNRDKLLFHLLVFVLLAGMLFYLRQKARPLVEANPDLRQGAVIFYLPVWTALLMAIVFSSQIYPQTPQILAAIFGAVALIPTVIILRKFLEPAFYPLLYSLVLFYFTDQLRAAFDGVPAVARPLFLTEILCAFLFFWWFYRARLSCDDPPEDVIGRRVFRVLRVLSRAVLPFFAIAFAANILGFVNLARLIGDAVLRSLYAALVIYAAVRIIDGLVIFALRFRPLNLLKMVRDFAPVIQEKMQKLVRFVALVVWIVIVLELFTLREIVFREGWTALTAELQLGSLSISAADVLLFFVVVWTAFRISRFVRFALEEDVYPRFSLAQGIPYAVSTIINYLILLLGFFFAVAAAGFDLTRFSILVGAFGVGIGFGLQNIFNNFVSGLILLFERPVKVGDLVKIGDATGTVKQIGIRASRIRQWDSSEIIVPNSKLISENVKNWSLSSRKRGIEIPVSVAFNSDAGRVVELLREAAAEHPLIARDPAPEVLLSEVVTPALTFRLRVWTTQPDKTMQITSELATAISRRLAEYDIEVTPAAAPAPG